MKSDGDESDEDEKIKWTIGMVKDAFRKAGNAQTVTADKFPEVSVNCLFFFCFFLMNSTQPFFLWVFVFL